MLIIANWNYAGISKFVSHAVMLSLTNEPKTLCGMNTYELLTREGQQWETDETNEPRPVGCKKCIKKLEGKKDNYHSV